MPIYEFRCPECLREEERLLLVADRNVPQVHSCGATMKRLMSIPLPAIVSLTGRDISFQTLNKEDGRDFPTRAGDRQRMEMAMVRGLDQRAPTMGIGFGK